MSDRVEFYKNNGKYPFHSVDSSFQPNTDDLVSIRGTTWKVVGRSFTLDYAGDPIQMMRCNLIVKEVKP